MGRVSVKNNQHVKYESYVIKRSHDYELKPCVNFLQVTLVTFNLVNANSKRAITSPKPISM